MTLDEIHDLMQQVCRDKAGNGQVGAFFLVSWLVGNIQRDFADAEIYAKDLSYPTPFPKINASLQIDPNTIALAINAGRIFLDGFSPVIVYQEPGKKPRPYNKITIKFDRVYLKLNQDFTQPGKLRFYLL